MTKCVLDSSTSEKLDRYTTCVELCDESGRVLGHFIPAEDRSSYEGVEVPFTNEELDRFDQEGGGRSLKEILADLERNS